MRSSKNVDKNFQVLYAGRKVPQHFAIYHGRLGYGNMRSGLHDDFKEAYEIPKLCLPYVCKLGISVASTVANN